MAKERRVKRLLDMLDRLEQLPASPDRDRLLDEVRSRAVDLDTGVTPRPLLPLREPPPPAQPAPPAPPARSKRATTSRPTAPPRPALALGTADFAAAAPSRAPSPEPPPCLEGRLSLEDSLQPSPLPELPGRGGRSVPPWTRGLRG